MSYIGPQQVHRVLPSRSSFIIVQCDIGYSYSLDMAYHSEILLVSSHARMASQYSGLESKVEDLQDYFPIVSTPHHQHTMEYHVQWQNAQPIPIGLNDEDEKGEGEGYEEDEKEGDDEDDMAPMDKGAPLSPIKPINLVVPSSSRVAPCIPTSTIGIPNSTS